MNIIGIRQIAGICLAENIASRRVMEKCGMRRAGMEKAERKFDSGEFCDVLVYEIEKP